MITIYETRIPDSQTLRKEVEALIEKSRKIRAELATYNEYMRTPSSRKRKQDKT